MQFNAGESNVPIRVAIVHDWLYTIGGAERVLRAMLLCFPNATVYALFDALTPSDRAKIGLGATRTSFLQHMPGMPRRHRLYLPLMPLAVEQFDLSGYDLIISSSYAVAKGVLTGPDQFHLAYVHSPMRYAWDLQHQYLREAKLEKGARGWLTRWLLHRMRMWDSRTAQGVNSWVANSHFVARRVHKVYGRRAVVIPPPVTVPDRPPSAKKEDYFLAASRLVPYKNVRAIVQAFAELPDQTLVVAGDGPERGRLEAIAGPNVRFRGFLPDAEMRLLMGRARAFIFAAEEDFGIMPLEAQAEGTPVIALGRGGARETIATAGPAQTGLFFDVAEPFSIAAAVIRFIKREGDFSAVACWRNAGRFSEDRFIADFANRVHHDLASFRDSIGSTGHSLSQVHRESMASVEAMEEIA